jgi:hypothetical protein
MTKHIMALTYIQKIDPVRRNECRQTIRLKKAKPVQAGDIINFHGWQDRPYRSPWTSRKTVTVKTVSNIVCTSECMKGSFWALRWDDPYMDELAKMDYISPATGEALRDVLFSLNKPPTEPQEYQIIRW